MTPSRNAASETSQNPDTTSRTRGAARRALSGCGSSAGLAAGVAHARAPSAMPPAASTAKAVAGPTTDASPPSTGPRSAPAIAAPMVMPISSPRRSFGAAAISHARPPVRAAGYTLAEAGEIQDPGALGETERDARGHDDREAGEDGRLDPGLDGEQAAGSPDEPSKRVDSRQDAERRRREAELVLVIRE